MRSLKQITPQNRESSLPKDGSLSGMPLLLDANRVRDLIDSRWGSVNGKLTDCLVEYVRYKPATNCLATYRVTHEKTDGTSFDAMYFGKSYTVGDFELAVAKIRAKRETSGVASSAPVIATDHQVIIDEMRNDPHLEGLETLLDPRKLRRQFYEWLPHYPQSEWRISYKQMKAAYVRYKPEKRAVVRFNTVAAHRSTDARAQIEIYARCYCDDRGSELFGLMRSLHEDFESDARIVVPKPYAYLDDKRILLVQGVAGTVLLDALTGSDCEDALTRTAQALYRLHAVTALDLPIRDVPSLITEAEAGAVTLRTILPERAAQIEEIVTAIGKGLGAVTVRMGFVHGDFHHGQLLLQHDKEVLLDFDRSYRGNVHADVGNFCAHLRVLEAEQRISNAAKAESTFVAAYEHASGSTINRDECARWTALGLYLLAVRPFRTLRPEWRDEVAAILDLCLRTLP